MSSVAQPCPGGQPSFYPPFQERSPPSGTGWAVYSCLQATRPQATCSSIDIFIPSELLQCDHISFIIKTKQNKIERSLVFKPIILKLNFYFSHPWLPTWITLGMFKDGCWVPHIAHAISLARVLGIFRTPKWFEHVAKLKSTRQRRDRGKKASGSWMGAALSQICFLWPCMCIKVRGEFWLSLSWATCSPNPRCLCLPSCPCLRVPSSAWDTLLSPLGQVRLWTLAQ